MAEAFLKVVLSNINSKIGKEIGLLWGIKKEMLKLSSLLTTIQAVTEDAEVKQSKDRAIRNWLQKLNIAAHEADDILDECATEASRLKHKGKCATPSCYPSGNILFRHRIGKRMKDIIDRLTEIADERMKYHFKESTGMKQVKADFVELRETSSILTQLEVFGRDEEREEIVDILVNQINDVQRTSVLPILGVGGLGKTTLAQFVYNDERVCKRFELKLWVCVSDDFSVKGITKAIIQSASGSASEAMELDPLQRKLQEMLKGKRYLLVLDDVWNDDQEKWEKFKCGIESGCSGSLVLTTTRMEKVAKIMGTLPTFHLSNLSEDDCWLLFRQRAFGQEAEEHPNLVAVGKEIVKKCGGVPLAAKALGGLLRFKREEKEWLFVKESELWNLPEDESSILPALRLSYYNLPSELRQCFAYCAAYPKDSIMEKDEVIQLWMANGFISPKGKLELEDVGDAIWNELYWRSFFQEAKKDNYRDVTTFKMHDLVHDLAESVMEGKYRAAEVEGSSILSQRTVRYAKLDNVKLSGDFPRIENLKLSVAFPRSTVSGEDSSKFLAQYRSLRTFKIHFEYNLNEVPLSAIGNMKHLRNLNLSMTAITMLPNSICQLWNLQTLNLNYCRKLRSLPKKMRCLKNLRHLYLVDCPLTHFPSGIGQLASLKTLTQFVVAEGKGCRISELRDLNLRGDLRICHLERVENHEEAAEANLIGKENLRRLVLSWEPGRRWQQNHRNDEQVLQSLKPPPNLPLLTIENFKGTSFPNWFVVSTLKNIVEISVTGCTNCRSLGVLGDLPHLRRLGVWGPIPVECFDDEDDTLGTARFPSLIYLQLASIPSLKHLSRSTSIKGQGGGEIMSFPRLQSLEVLFCSNLTSLLGDGLRLKGALNSLTRLHICDCEKLESLTEGELPCLSSLERLHILHCPALKIQIKNLKSLRDLSLREFSWEAFPEELLELQNGSTLRSLSVNSFPNLTSLPPRLGELISLESLRIESCPKLKALPDSIQRMTSLRSLKIYKCPALERRYDQKRNGEDWHKIQHIPDIYISYTLFTCRQ